MCYLGSLNKDGLQSSHKERITILDLMLEQWIMTEELTQMFEPFERATVFLRGEHYVTHESTTNMEEDCPATQAKGSSHLLSCSQIIIRLQ